MDKFIDRPSSIDYHLIKNRGIRKEKLRIIDLAKQLMLEQHGLTDLVEILESET